MENRTNVVVGFKINPMGRWNFLQSGVKGQYKTYGTFQGYCRDESTGMENSRGAMNPSGEYYIIKQGERIELGDDNYKDWDY